MNFARVIGTVWATRKDPTVEGITLRIGEVLVLGAVACEQITLPRCLTALPLLVEGGREAVTVLRRKLGDRKSALRCDHDLAEWLVREGRFDEARGIRVRTMGRRL